MGEALNCSSALRPHHLTLAGVFGSGAPAPLAIGNAGRRPGLDAPQALSLFFQASSRISHELSRH